MSVDVANQAGAIPIRRRGTQVEVCLIRRKDSRAWGIPKGMVDPGDTHVETALNEAWEEAGLSGRVRGQPLGIYEYEKWQGNFTVAVYVLDVEAEHDDWQEAGFRERRWMSFEEADRRLAGHPVRSLVNRVADTLAGLA